MGKSHYIIPIFVPHEGCPHNCVFCNQNTITGSGSKVDKEFVEKTIEEYLDTINNNNSKELTIEVSFFGGTFTAIDIEKQKELLAVAYKYKIQGKINYIHLSTRPDYIDDYILTNLKNYSVDVIELGVQSLDNEVLIKSGRGHSSEDVEKASKLIKEYGFTLGHQMMIGLPGDNKEKDLYTAEKIISMEPEICRIYPALIIKNTPMEKMYIDNIYNPYTLEEAIEISKELYMMFIANDINVIRIGLQPTEEINEGAELVKGPFHPAFRELVESSIINDIILEKVPKDYKNELTIEVNSRDISKLYAGKKKYFNILKDKLKSVKIKVSQQNKLDRGTYIVKLKGKSEKIGIPECAKEKYKKGKSTTL